MWTQVNRRPKDSSVGHVILTINIYNSKLKKVNVIHILRKIFNLIKKFNWRSLIQKNSIKIKSNFEN